MGGRRMIAYRPVAGPVEISGDTASHATYGVGPATDYKVGTGTRVLAPITGTISRWWSTSGGNTVVVDGDGWTGFGQHLSAYAGSGLTSSANALDLIALSGNTGAITTGPHLHWWMIRDDGERFSMEEFIAMQGGTLTPIGYYTPSGTAPAGGGGTPFPDNQEEDEMKSGQIHYPLGGGKGYMRALFVPGTAYFMPFTEGTGATIANGFAKNLETNNSTLVTQSVFDAMKTAAARCEGSK